MIRVIRILFLLACLFTPLLVHAQALPIDKLTPPLPTASERKIADIASWGTVLAAVALDAKSSWDAPDRKRALILQGTRVGITYGAVFLVKTLIHRERPCAPSSSCGTDNPDFSFYSAHTALAFSTIGGPRLAFALPLSIGTGGLRVAGGKHYLSDVLVGAGAGWLTGRFVR